MSVLAQGNGCATACCWGHAVLCLQFACWTGLCLLMDNESGLSASPAPCIPRVWDIPVYLGMLMRQCLMQDTAAGGADI